jgi:O-antigen/teichoic acid export membrane protein
MGFVVLLHAGMLFILLADAPGEARSAAAFSLATGPAIVAQHYALSMLQGQSDFRGFNLLRLLPFLVTSLAVAAAFVLGGDDLVLLVVVWTASYVLAAVLTVVWAWTRLPSRDERHFAPPLRELLRFGGKGLIGAASPVETFRLDQAIVGVFLSPAALGLYAAGLAFTNLPRLVGLGVGAVAYPSVAARPELVPARRAMWRFFALTLAASTVIALALEPIAGWLVTFFFGAAFEDAIPITRILLIGAPFLAARRVLTDASRGAGLPGMGSVSELASWAVLVPAVVVGASLAGLTGVAWALVFSSAVSLAILVVAVLIASRRSIGRAATGPGPPAATPVAGTSAAQAAHEPGPA